MKRLMVVLLLAGMAFGAPPKPIPGWATPQHRFSFLRTMFDTRTGGGSGASYPCCSDNGTVLTSTEPLVLPVGTGPATATSALQFGTNAVFYAPSANTLRMASGGSDRIEFSAQGITLVANGANGYSAGTVGTPDTFFRRKGAANWMLGAADVNGVPVAQILSVQNAITGSNLPGSALTIAGPLGTGTGLPAPIIIQGADQSVASGATAQTEIHRLVIGDTKNLTTGAATTVLSIPLATLQMAGGNIAFHMEATDGTNQCTRDGMTAFSAENSAGVFVTNVTDATGTLDSTACTAAKTLTLAWAVTGANPALVQVTPTLTGITATRFSINYTVMYGGNTQPTL